MTQPLSRYSTADLARLIAAHPDAPGMSRSTIWRILAQDALKPWRYQGWLFPRDPQFAAKAGRVLDLYAGWWEGQPLAPDDCILSADEQTSIQARGRRHATTPPRPGQPMRVEHEYARGGALAGAPWAHGRLGRAPGRRHRPLRGDDRHRPVRPPGRAGDGPGALPQRPARLLGRRQRQQPPRRAAAARLQARYPNLILVHLPTHASWLNQIAIFFSIVQRKVLTPNDFPDLAAVERACWPSRRSTTTPPSPSTGASPAPTSKTASPRSRSSHRRDRSQPRRRPPPTTPSPPNPTRIHEMEHLAPALVEQPANRPQPILEALATAFLGHRTPPAYTTSLEAGLPHAPPASHIAVEKRLRPASAPLPEGAASRP